MLIENVHCVDLFRVKRISNACCHDFFSLFRTMQASSLVFNLDTQWRCCCFARWQCRNGKTLYNMQHANHHNHFIRIESQQNACDDVDVRKQKGWNWNFLSCNWAIHHQQHDYRSFFVDAWCSTFEWYIFIDLTRTVKNTHMQRTRREKSLAETITPWILLNLPHFKHHKLDVYSTMFEYQFPFSCCFDRRLPQLNALQFGTLTHFEMPEHNLNANFYWNEIVEGVCTHTYTHQEIQSLSRVQQCWKIRCVYCDKSHGFGR